MLLCVSVVGVFFQSSELKATQLGGTVGGSLQGTGERTSEPTKNLWRSPDVAPLPASVCSS